MNPALISPVMRPGQSCRYEPSTDLYSHEARTRVADMNPALISPVMRPGQSCRYEPSTDLYCHEARTELQI